MHTILQKTLVICIFAIGLSSSARSAQSFLVADQQTGAILKSDDQNNKLPIGDLTQLATSMVVLDCLRASNQNLSVTTSVASVAIQSTVGLQAGDRISLRDLLYCVVLSSDRLAAYTLADFMGSNIPNPRGLSGKDNFVSQMNALASQLEMTRTRFTSPDGSDQRRKPSYSTATDMGRLVRYAYARPEFPFYAEQASRVISLSRQGKPLSFRIRNTNSLLGKDRIDGAKAGFSSRIGQCLALTADRPSESARQGNLVMVTPRRLIIILLGSPNGFSEGLELLQQGWALYDQWAASGRPNQERNSL